MVFLENEAFLSELTRLFLKSKTSGAGSLLITMKKYDCSTKPKPRDGKIQEPLEYRCLFRASLGGKKISTTVSQKDVNRFQVAYANLLKGNIDNLKKKDKKNASKSKAKMKAKA